VFADKTLISTMESFLYEHYAAYIACGKFHANTSQCNLQKIVEYFREITSF
jgi:hypothetical protein